MAVARRRLAFVFGFCGIVDLLAVLPAFLPVAADLRSIRVVRLFRLFRILKVVRYTAALDRLGRAFARVRTELALFTMACGVILYAASVGIYHVEREAQPEAFGSLLDALRWAVATLTTVGYGVSTR